MSDNQGKRLDTADSDKPRRGGPKRPGAPPPNKQVSTNTPDKQEKKAAYVPPPPAAPPPIDEDTIQKAEAELAEFNRKQEEERKRKEKEDAEFRRANARKLAAEEKRRQAEEKQRQRQLELEAKRKKKPPPRRRGPLPPPPPPFLPPAWVKIPDVIVPRGRLDIHISRVHNIGPGTSLTEDENNTLSRTRTATRLFHSLSRTITGTRRTVTSDGRIDYGEGSVYLRFELNLGTARMPGKSELFKGVTIQDFETHGCTIEFPIFEGIPAPIVPKTKLSAEDKMSIPPILFYSVWRVGRIDDEMIAEGQIAAGALLQSTQRVGAVQITLPLRGPKQRHLGPIKREEDIKSWIIASFEFFPSRAGILSLTVHEGKELFNAQPIGKQDPYPILQLGNGNIAKGTVCKEGGTSPMFNHEELVLWVDHHNCTSKTPFVLQLMNENVTGLGLIGEYLVDVDKWVNDFDVHHETVQLVRGGGGNKAAGSASITRQFYPAGQLSIRVLEGKNLAVADVAGGNDAFVRVQLEGRVRNYDVKTSIKPNCGTHPIFNETFIFDIVDQYEAHIGIWDFDKFSSDDLIGEVTIELGALFRYGMRDASVPVKMKGSWGGLEDRGIIVIEADFSGPATVSYPMLRPDQPAYDDRERKNRYGLSPAELHAERLKKANEDRIKKERDAALEAMTSEDVTDEDIEKAFVFVDLNNDLYIGRKEIRHVLSGMGEQVTDLEIDEMIQMADHDGDGLIAFYEFYQVSKNDLNDIGQTMWKPQPEENFKRRDWYAEGGVKGLEPPPIRLGPNGELVLAVTDAAETMRNRKYALLRAQDLQKKAYKKNICERLTSGLAIQLEDLQRVFRRFIRMPAFRDENGNLTFPEMAEAFDVEPTEDFREVFNIFVDEKTDRVNMREILLALNNFTGCTKPQRINFCFFLFDLDHSGCISASELLSILKASHLTTNEKMLQTKVDTLMKQADKDGNAQIDLEEFVILANRFPNVLFPNYNVSSFDVMKGGDAFNKVTMNSAADIKRK